MNEMQLRQKWQSGDDSVVLNVTNTKSGINLAGAVKTRIFQTKNRKKFTWIGPMSGTVNFFKGLIFLLVLLMKIHITVNNVTAGAVGWMNVVKNYLYLFCTVNYVITRAALIVIHMHPRAIFAMVFFAPNAETRLSARIVVNLSARIVDLFQNFH